MKMKLEIEFDDAFVEKIVREIMDNFPEASGGNAMMCTDWKYKDMRFEFEDGETGDTVPLDRDKLMAAFPLMYTEKWPRGLRVPPLVQNEELWDNWLCQSDAITFDAFAQLAAFGEVIYG